MVIRFWGRPNKLPIFCQTAPLRQAVCIDAEFTSHSLYRRAGLQSLSNNVRFRIMRPSAATIGAKFNSQRAEKLRQRLHRENPLSCYDKVKSGSIEATQRDKK